MSTYRVWRRICLRDFPQYQDSHNIRQIIYKTSAFFIVASTLILLPCIASAQSPPPPGVNIPPNTPERIDQTLPKPTPSPSPPIPAPPSPILPEPTQKPPDISFPTTETFFVKKIEVLGSTVLPKILGNRAPRDARLREGRL